MKNATERFLSRPRQAGRGKIYVRLTEGRFQNLRRLVSWPLMALFFALVWVQIKGESLLLFSYEQRRINLFGQAYSWNELPLLAGLMIAGAFLLFLMAVAFGRVWCGFACPQSIWTWLFIRVEQFMEGSPNARRKADQQALRGVRLVRRVGKHIIWLMLAALTALTFTGYFIPVRELLSGLVRLDLPIYVFGWMLTVTALTYLNAGLMREKICMNACPYSRFQTVMFDRHTRTVSYDRGRGEPRAPLRQLSDQAGDCVDCGVCVQVCPTGIDIRNGMQAGCIDCGACIDACDTVMTKLDRPAGLIRFASEAELEGRPRRTLRPQLVGYGVLLIGALSGVFLGFSQTSGLTVAVQRDRMALYSQQVEGTICNHYRLKVEGVDTRIKHVQVSLTDHRRFTLIGESRIDLSDHNATWLPYRVCTQNPGGRRAAVTFSVRGIEVTATKETTFLTPMI